ncbi:N-acetylmuramoyl-L-alanine amidase [Treponema sp.]|uniref:N-acetylmuramoyl-L-alanine amidase family protein n=1 Tax=Treponema sp. TaxID=166 RepID=UPI00298DA840|nr:N-acetylmuramoyl-L-alanine amidase [Treponema sp.]MCQ2241838.1 N-acetylmuramoyl-L-alanine amidase [Treponema sp.]
MKKLIFTIFALFMITSHAFSENAGNMDFLSSVQKAGMTFYWDPLTSSGLIEKNGHRISFHSGDDFVLQDYKTVLNESAPVLENGKLVTSTSFMNSAENFFKTESNDNPYRIGAILIDPGHGGKDPGTNKVQKINGKNVTLVEKDINLNVGLKLRDYLKKAYPDKQILMTRSKDVYLSLNQRTEIANSVKLKDNEAILFISVHVNSNFNESASGYEVWYLSPGYRRQVLNAKSAGEEKSLLPILNSMMEEEYTTESILIAKFILDGITAQVGSQTNSRGIKAEEWYVCKNSNMPSVLIELGFVTNKKEAALLHDDKYLQKLSFGIYNGLQAFVTHFERSRGFTGK